MGKILIINGANFSSHSIEKVKLFPDKISINVISNFDGCVVSGTGTYDEGSVITIKAENNDTYTFDKWSDGSTESERTIVVGDGPTTYTAIFKNSGVAGLFTLHANGKCLWPGEPYYDEIGVYNVTFTSRGDYTNTVGKRVSTWESVDLSDSIFNNKTSIKITPKSGYRFSIAFGDETVRITDWIYFQSGSFIGDLTNEHAKKLGISISTPSDTEYLTSTNILDYVTIELT